MFEDMLDFDSETYQMMKEKVAEVGMRIKEFLTLESELPPEGI